MAIQLSFQYECHILLVVIRSILGHHPIVWLGLDLPSGELDVLVSVSPRWLAGWLEFVWRCEVRRCGMRDLSYSLFGLQHGGHG